jgi:hypothetical protein
LYLIKKNINAQSLNGFTLPFSYKIKVI